ncbi:hypothetical protein ABZW38_27470, partial [Streptomyces bacillaris]|uniref:hypothetical protein n=1 Tax=Streptomyces bacillaris TaxID=68179 RepID=UPI00345F5BD9
FSEHSNFPSNYGAWYIAGLLVALTSDPSRSALCCVRTGVGAGRTGTAWRARAGGRSPRGAFRTVMER